MFERRESAKNIEYFEFICIFLFNGVNSIDYTNNYFDHGI